MKFEFTDEITGDTWIEEYNSLDEINPEMLDGCSYKFVFDCSACNCRFKTDIEADAILGICKECQKKMDNHIEKEDVDSDG